MMCVENGSGDDSVEDPRQHPEHEADRVSGEHRVHGRLQSWCARATGRYVAFLNNDARPDPGWIREAVAELDEDPTIGSVASKVLDWEGETVDFVDGEMTWYGMGYKRQFGEPDDPAFDHPRNVLFGTGAAMFSRRSSSCRPAGSTSGTSCSSRTSTRAGG